MFKRKVPKNNLGTEGKVEAALLIKSYLISNQMRLIKLI